ncbi:hypothetical protein HAX54_003544 [Datura stramonium]|uniref:Uncharacterized protein n=1 Tax=Datura stramonium TaxID=4076 RepID=A0ABS8WUV6_DATST|nr:hypothetical protein [Datura stramonium]
MAGEMSILSGEEQPGEVAWPRSVLEVEARDGWYRAWPRLCFIASYTHWRKWCWELGDPHITKCRVWQGAPVREGTERRVARVLAFESSGRVRGVHQVGVGRMSRPWRTGYLKWTILGGWIGMLTQNWPREGVVANAVPLSVSAVAVCGSCRSWDWREGTSWQSAESFSVWRS